MICSESFFTTSVEHEVVSSTAATVGPSGAGDSAGASDDTTASAGGTSTMGATAIAGGSADEGADDGLGSDGATAEPTEGSCLTRRASSSIGRRGAQLNHCVATNAAIDATARVAIVFFRRTRVP